MSAFILGCEVEELFVFIDATGGVNDGGFVLEGDGMVGDVVTHAATGEADGEFFIAADQQEILRLVERGERTVGAGKSFNVGESGVPLPFNDDWMNVFDFRAGVGDDGALSDLPIAIEGAVANFVNADRNAIEIEVGKLSVSGGAEINAAVSAEGK